MGIRAGEPHPMMAMKVGMGRCSRVEGEMDCVRVRRYSWQFYFLINDSSPFQVILVGEMGIGIGGLRDRDDESYIHHRRSV